MFEWSTGSVLRSMVNAGVPGAEYDDWLEGWIRGLLQCRLQFVEAPRILDITLGDGERSWLESWKNSGAHIDTTPANRLSTAKDSFDAANRYDLVTLISLERETCLQSIDFENPLPFLSMLLDAAEFVAPGGILIWSDLYCFPSDPDHLRSFLEPAAIYQAVVRRQFPPLSSDYSGKERIAIDHDPDTLFVRHKSLLNYSDRHERVARFCCGVRTPGRLGRVRFVTMDQALGGSTQQAAAK